MTREMELLNKYKFWKDYSASYSDEYAYHDANADDENYRLPYIYERTPEELVEAAYGMTREHNDDWLVELLYRVIKKGKTLHSAYDSIIAESSDHGGPGVNFLHPDPVGDL